MHKLPLIKVSYFVDMGYHKRRSGMFSSIKSTAQIRRTFQRVPGYWKKDRQSGGIIEKQEAKVFLQLYPRTFDLVNRCIR